MKRRPKGIENEHGIMFEDGRGNLSNPKWLIPRLMEEVIKDLHLPYTLRSKLFRDLLLCSEEERGMGGRLNSVWIGATGGTFFGDFGDNVLEHAGPECTTIESVADSDRQGDLILSAIADEVCRAGFYVGATEIRKILIFKNNSDIFREPKHPRELHIFGSHENYFCRELFLLGGEGEREEKLFAKALFSLLAVRQVLTGSGGLFFDDAVRWQYVISPRALFTNLLVSSSVTGPRPVVSYRSQEGDSPPGYFRLHIPTNDSNQMKQAVRFRFAIIDAFLSFWEESEGSLPELPFLESPVRALHDFSKDPTLQVAAKIAGRKKEMNALDLFLLWIEILRTFAEAHKRSVDEEICNLLGRAYSILEEAKKNLEILEEETEWGFRLSRLRDYCQKGKIDFTNKKARAFDLRYALLSKDGLYTRFKKSEGGDDLFSKEEFEKVVLGHRAAPRAELRKRYIAAHARRDAVIGLHRWANFYIPELGTVHISDPRTATDPRVEAYLKKIS